MPLHTDYRPQTLDEIQGNRATVQSLRTLLAREDKPHTYLFTGPTGCGKSTLARITGWMLGCSEMDWKEYNAANARGIDTIREITINARFAPMNGKVRVYFLDEVHAITGTSGEALLKLLEDPPKHAFFLLATTNPEKLPATLRNRCSIFPVHPLSLREMEGLLDWVLGCEKRTLEEEPRRALLRVAGGCPRQLLVCLDQVIDLPPTEQIPVLRNGAPPDRAAGAGELSKVICKKGEPNSRWKEIVEILEAMEGEEGGWDEVRRAILGYLAKVLQNSPSPEIARAMPYFLDSLLYTGKPGLILSLYSAIFQGR